MTYHSSFLAYCTERGYIHQGTDLEGLDKLLAESKKPVPAYCGFDCTADSLHVGNLLPIMVMRAYQRHGGKPIILMGGGTTKIGDPSGKDESRQLLTDEKIERNMVGIVEVFGRFLDFEESEGGAVMVNNDDWLSGIKYIDFLRDYGRHFSINRMLTFDSVKLRLEREQNLSFLEFNYMLLQAYDFVELNRRYLCRLQFGGSDQWGNIVSGVELKRRIDALHPDRKSHEIFGLTTPLLTTASGAKMGKTASGAVWLNEDLMSVYDFWQYWRNTEDADVSRFLRLYTELPIEEITTLEQLQGAAINEAKKVLATEVTALVHGRAAAEKAAENARLTFEEGQSGANLPEVVLNGIEAPEGLPVYTLLVHAGLAESAGEARRLVRGRGAKVNDRVIEDENEKILLQTPVKLSAGKKRHVMVRLG